MSAIDVFQFPATSQQIRALIRDGEPWFVAGDITTALGIANGRDAVSRLDKSARGVGETDTPGGRQRVTIISEAGMYRLAMRSNRPDAIHFQMWISYDVLPSIRKTGAYMLPELDELEVARRYVAALECVGLVGPIRRWRIHGGDNAAHCGLSFSSYFRRDCASVGAMPERTSTAHWQGNPTEGFGLLTTGKGGITSNYSLESRYEEGEGTNPEELIAASHAACFSMALSHKLADAGYPSISLETSATVQLEETDAGFAVTRIDLSSTGDVPGIDAARFGTLAEQAKTTCPISRLLEPGTEITLSARLA